MRHLALLCLLCLFSAFTLTNEVRKGIIIVEFDQLEAQNGIVEVSLFNNGDNFLEAGHASFKKRQKVVNGKVKVIFTNIPFGNYAAVSYHDINENSEIDKNFIGLPKEPVAVSRVTKKQFSLPNFNDAKIDFNQAEMVVKLQFLKY